MQSRLVRPADQCAGVQVVVERQVPRQSSRSDGRRAAPVADL